MCAWMFVGGQRTFRNNSDKRLTMSFWKLLMLGLTSFDKQLSKQQLSFYTQLEICSTFCLLFIQRQLWCEIKFLVSLFLKLDALLIWQDSPEHGKPTQVESSRTKNIFPKFSSSILDRRTLRITDKKTWGNIVKKILSWQQTSLHYRFHN